MAFILYDEDKLIENARTIKQLCGANNLEFVAVTKCICSYPPVVQLLAEQGITSFADSNLASITDFLSASGSGTVFSLIRTRMSDIVTACGICFPQRIFVSDIDMLKRLKALPAESCPQIVLIVEVGDCRDGFSAEQLRRVFWQFKNLPIAGVSGNFACLEGQEPVIEQLEVLNCAADMCEQITGKKACISGGGTVLWDMLQCGVLESRLTEIRMGEALFLGWNSKCNKPIPELHQDIWIFSGEILETAYKDISGIRRLRTVLDFGKLAAPIGSLASKNPEMPLCGQTFDYTVVDISDFNRRIQSDYKAGKTIPFAVDYHVLSQIMLNRFVGKGGTVHD